MREHRLMITLVLVRTARGCLWGDDCAVDIVGGAECIGAEIFVDAALHGTMTRWAGDGSHAAILLKTGTHTVEFQRPGFTGQPLHVEIPAGNTEHYLVCEL